MSTSENIRQEFKSEKQLTLPSFRKDFKFSTHCVSRQVKVKRSLVCALSAFLISLNWKKEKKREKRQPICYRRIVVKTGGVLFLAGTQATSMYRSMPILFAHSCQDLSTLNQVKEIILEGDALERVKVEYLDYR